MDEPWTQTTEWACSVCPAGRLAETRRKIVAYPMTNMSTLPSETSGPNREATSSGGTAEPTFHVTMCTLSASGDALKVKVLYTYWCGDEREDIICACNPRRNKLSTALLHIGRKKDKHN